MLRCLVCGRYVAVLGSPTQVLYHTDVASSWENMRNVVPGTHNDSFCFNKVVRISPTHSTFLQAFLAVDPGK